MKKFLRTAAFVAIALLTAFAPPVAIAGPDIQFHMNRGDCVGDDGCIKIVGGVCHVFVITPSAVQHEVDHCNGQRHSAWRSVNGRPCATVLRRGETAQKPGQIMCRREDGSFVLFDS